MTGQGRAHTGHVVHTHEDNIACPLIAITFHLGRRCTLKEMMKQGEAENNALMDDILRYILSARDNDPTMRRLQRKLMGMLRASRARGKTLGLPPQPIDTEAEARADAAAGIAEEGAVEEGECKVA